MITVEQLKEAKFQDAKQKDGKIAFRLSNFGNYFIVLTPCEFHSDFQIISIINYDLKKVVFTGDAENIYDLINCIELFNLKNGL